MEISTMTTIAFFSALVAAASALVSVLNYRREQTNQKIAAAKWKKEYFADLLKWSDETMLMLSEALHLNDLDPRRMEKPSFFETRHLLRVKISAQIDKGRWFFPNSLVEGAGNHKPEAFRGYRHEVLDGLVATYRELDLMDCKGRSNNRQRRPGIEQAKRLFTSENQKVLNPRSRDEEFQKLLGVVSGQKNGKNSRDAG